jgi:hypothetical protein
LYRCTERKAASAAEKKAESIKARRKASNSSGIGGVSMALSVSGKRFALHG